MTTPPDHSGITVIKLGGSTLGAPTRVGNDTSLRDIADARREGHRIVVVHGGGATISAWLERTGVPARFVRGLRVTDEAALDVVVAVLAGVVNKQIVAELAALGAPAIGLSGADGMILQARRYDDELGYVGKIHRVNPHPINELLQLGHLPVIAPIAIEVDAAGGGPTTSAQDAQLLNTNADTAAGEIAAALRAERLIFLTDVEGVLDARKRLIPRLTVDEARALIESGTATAGMIPKLEAAITAASGACSTRIVDGTAAHAVGRALSNSTDSAGSVVSR